MRERLNTPRAAWSLTRTEVINRFRFVFSGEIYRSSYWMILHFWDKPKEWKCHWTMWQKAQSQRHFGAPWKADTTSCVKITNGTTLFYSDLKNSSLFHKKHTFNGHLFYISEECECLWGPCVCVWKTDADREGKNLMFKQCSIILSVLTPLSSLPALLWFLPNTRLDTHTHTHREIERNNFITFIFSLPILIVLISCWCHSVWDVLSWSWHTYTAAHVRPWRAFSLGAGAGFKDETAAAASTFPELTCGKGSHHIRHIKVSLRLPGEENRRREGMKQEIG